MMVGERKTVNLLLGSERDRHVPLSHELTIC